MQHQIRCRDVQQFLIFISLHYQVGDIHVRTYIYLCLSVSHKERYLKRLPAPVIEGPSILSTKKVLLLLQCTAASKEWTCRGRFWPLLFCAWKDPTCGTCPLSMSMKEVLHCPKAASKGWCCQCPGRFRRLLLRVWKDPTSGTCPHAVWRTHFNWQRRFNWQKHFKWQRRVTVKLRPAGAADNFSGGREWQIMDSMAFHTLKDILGMSV